MPELSLRIFIVALMSTFIFPLFSMAADKASKEECVEKVKQAEAVLKELDLKNALEKIMEKNGPFIWKDSYVFIIDSTSGKVLAHLNKSIIGYNMQNYIDGEGKQPFKTLYEPGSGIENGWLVYKHFIPKDGYSITKETYFRKLPNAGVIICAGVTQPIDSLAVEPYEKKKAEVFAEIGGGLHGLVIDSSGNMYAARNGNEIMKVTPKGEISVLCRIEEGSGFGSQGTGGVYIYDLAMGPDGAIYAAAENRILKITPDGKVLTLIKEDFPGPWGACGLDFDRHGNLYVAYGNKVVKYNPALEKNEFIDGDKKEFSLKSAIGITFDRKFEIFYICDAYGKKVIRFPVDSSGAYGKPNVIYKTELFQPEYIAVDKNDRVIVSNYDSGILISVMPDGTTKAVRYENMGGNETIALAEKGSGDSVLYVSSWRTGNVYKVPLE